MKLTFRPLSPRIWPDVERLFGPRGACGGCWCMYWRTHRGQEWDRIKGEENRRALRKLVRSGKAYGLIAYDSGKPVGWASFGPRVEYDRLNRSPSLACGDAEKVWSIPCFFVKAGHRKQGVALQLLGQAVRYLRKRKVKILEGYPLRPSPDGRQIPAAFAYTGTVSMFRKAGFRPAETRPRGKQRMRLSL